MANQRGFGFRGRCRFRGTLGFSIALLGVLVVGAMSIYASLMHRGNSHLPNFETHDQIENANTKTNKALASENASIDIEFSMAGKHIEENNMNTNDKYFQWKAEPPSTGMKRGNCCWEPRIFTTKIEEIITDNMTPLLGPNSERISWIPEITADPRTILRMHLSQRKQLQKWECPGNPFSVMGPEDIAANRTRCLQLDQGIVGFLYTTKHSPGRLFAYVENYKVGSTTIVDNLDEHHCPHVASFKGMHDKAINNSVNCLVTLQRGGYDIIAKHSMAKQQPITAFSFVRHPVDRFVSGYATMLLHFDWNYKNLTSRTKQLMDLKEPQRFSAFVDYITDQGTRIVEPFTRKCNGDGQARVEKVENFFTSEEAAGYLHMFSQTWFLSQYPGRIQYIGKFENNFNSSLKWIMTDLMSLSKVYSISRNNKRMKLYSFTKKYLKEPSLRQTIERLNRYFAFELDLFGYKPR
eukprot:jgi/Bigna1/135019/aug1.27_g9727